MRNQSYNRCLQIFLSKQAFTRVRWRKPLTWPVHSRAYDAPVTMYRTSLLPFAAVLLVGCTPQDAPAPQVSVDEPTARVFFASPADGDSVASPVSIAMSAEGMEVKPAGTMEEGSGHFHIIIDQPFVEAGMVVPTDSAHVHFGDASTSASLDLAPGEHVLRLQFADGAHIALAGLTDQIRVSVQ